MTHRPLPSCAPFLADQAQRLPYFKRAGNQGNTWPEITRGVQSDFILRQKEKGTLFSNRFGSAKLSLKSEMGAALSRCSWSKAPSHPEPLECAQSLIARLAGYY